MREATAASIEARFVDGPRSSAVDTINAQGNASIKIHAPPAAANNANSAERQLAADAVTLQFFAGGRFIKLADAVGNAVMIITPVRAERGRDKKTIRAPRMNAVFYEEGNRVKTFTATDGVNRGTVLICVVKVSVTPSTL